MIVATYLLWYFLVGLVFVLSVKPSAPGIKGDDVVGEVPPGYWLVAWPLVLVVIAVGVVSSSLDGKLQKLHGALRRKG